MEVTWCQDVPDPFFGCGESHMSNVSEIGGARFVFTPQNLTIPSHNVIYDAAKGEITHDEYHTDPFTGDIETRVFNANKEDVVGAFELLWKYRPPGKGNISNVIWRYPLLP